MAVLQRDQITITDITDGYSVSLVPSSTSLSGGVTSLGTAQSVTVNVVALQGGTKVTPSVGTPVCPSNVSATVGTASNNEVPVTISFAAALNTAGKVTIPVTVNNEVIMNQEFPFSIAFAGAPGATASSYDLIVSHAAVVSDAGGSAYTPTSISLTAKKTEGTGNPANYDGRFKIETTTNGTTWSAAYTSSSNESSKVWTITGSSLKSIRCSLYLAGGTTTLLDQQTIPIVYDGVKGDTGSTGATGGIGPSGADAYTVVLGNESHSFAGGVSAAIQSSTDCPVIAYKGATQIAATIGTITGAPTGMSTSISNNGSTSAKFTVSVTGSMTTKNGTLSVPITVDGHSFTKVFTYSLSLTGNTGAKGDTGDNGEDALLVQILASGSTIFHNSNGSVTLTAYVTKGGVELTGANIPGTLKWYRDGGSSAVATGATYTVTAASVTNTTFIEVKLESS